MRPRPHKILVVRLSSIGDVVMTSPVVRSLKKAFPESEIHFFTKKAFVSLLAHNPHISKVHAYEGNLEANLRVFEQEDFDWIVDLHRSLRSGVLRRRLGVPAGVYRKFNLKTRAYIRFRVGNLPAMHVVDRYALALKPLGVELDGEGLEIFLPDSAREKAHSTLDGRFGTAALGVVLGATFGTKKWIPDYFPTLLNRLGKAVILLGGPADAEMGDRIASQLTVPYLNAVGQFNLLESSALLEQCEAVLTHDTGLMHIAVALGKKIFVLWGQTVPALGFTPYKAEAIHLEMEDLACRPCHKLGYAECPKGHFKCMRDLTPDRVYSTMINHLG
jgi:ADP-heptose:LPS heptosyltransferase